MRHHGARLLSVTLLAALAAGCSSAAEQFKLGRLLAPCDGAWPVCTTTAGCFIGDAHYLEGRFPGTRRFIVRTEGPADITVSVFLETQDAVGTETHIAWNDAGCGSRQVETLTGKAFFAEVEAEGALTREKPVYKPGDHLIEVDSDATALYLMKVDVREAGE